ncbi:MAG: M3 family metallopeptidase [Bacteroidales bacterium]|nr:M3 family metallopeptidase [Bacteroidales bacterium]
MTIFACTTETTMNNPLLEAFNTPHQTVPFDKIEPEHIESAFEIALKEAYEDVEKIKLNEEQPTFKNTIVALERSGKNLTTVTKVMMNLNHAETNDKLQALVQQASPKLSEFFTSVSLNDTLFKKVETIYNSKNSLQLSKEDLKLLNDSYKSFIRNGAKLEGKDKERYNTVSSELSKLTVQFAQNVLKETNAYTLHVTDSNDLKDLPSDVVAQAKKEAEKRELDGWIFTLQYPSFGPFLKYCNNRELREDIFRAYNSRSMSDNDNNNLDIIRQIVSLRLEKANLLGYQRYADYVLEERMAKTSDKVNTFLNDLLLASLPVAQQELAEVEAFAKKSGFQGDIMPWDWTFYSEKLKKEKFNVDEEMTRPYFELEHVNNAIFELSNTLFGITITENKDIPVYHEEVRAYEVKDEQGNHLAVLYMDFFPRETKQGGAWMTEFREQQLEDGKDLRPHVSLVFNLSRPTDDKPSLLTFQEVTTLLHEFGHGLHGIFSNVKYSSLSGTNVYRDFVELPSQILENWGEQKEWIQKIGKHYQTGEKIPAELLDNILNAKNFNSGYASVRQLRFGMYDMAWHTLSEPFNGDVIAFEKEAGEKTQLFPSVSGVAMSPSFRHIFAGGYAAGYYGYKWAEVLDADAFSVFLENGIYDKPTAQLFKETILEKGGTAHPMDLYLNFRGQEPTIDALLVRSGLKK